jgi:hypothetical protein
MMLFRRRSGYPSPNLTAAYVDGELSLADRMKFEDWLADHPAEATEVEALRRFALRWRETRPREPADSKWRKTLAAIEARLCTPSARSGGPENGRADTHRPSRWSVVLFRWTAAAAILWIVFAFERPPAEISPPVFDPLPVASPEDVDIVSVHAGDMTLLLVGDWPVREPLNLVAPGDVFLENVEPAPDGMLPYVRTGIESAQVPMIVAPLAVVSTSEQNSR